MVQGVFLFHDQQYFQNMVGVLEFVNSLYWFAATVLAVFPHFHSTHEIVSFMKFGAVNQYDSKSGFSNNIPHDKTKSVGI